MQIIVWLVNQQEGEAELYRLIYRFMFALTFEFVFVYLIAWSCVFVANSDVSLLLHFLLHITLIASHIIAMIGSTSHLHMPVALVLSSQLFKQAARR
jgi:hypothetical protein